MEDLSRKRTCKRKDMKKVKDKAQGYLEDKIFEANRRAAAKAPPTEKAVTQNREEAVWLDRVSKTGSRRRGQRGSGNSSGSQITGGLGGHFKDLGFTLNEWDASAAFQAGVVS